MLAEPAPLKSTVELFAVNVPLLVQFPLTDRVFEPAIVSEAPELRIMLWQTAAALITGWFPPGGIITFVAEVGTPPHQLEAVCQSVLVVPSQLPVTLTIMVIALEVAGLPVAHVAFDVSTQVTTSLFIGI